MYTTPFRIVPFLALLAPVVATAAPKVWLQADPVYVGELSATLEEQLTVAEREIELENHIEARTHAKERRQHARRDLREIRRQASADRRALRQAKSDDDSLRSARLELAISERSLMEAHDGLELQKAMVQAHDRHVKLHRAMLSAARANREEAQAEYLEDLIDPVPHLTEPYDRQTRRHQKRVRNRHADWKLAMVKVRERNQDYAVPGVATAVAPHTVHTRIVAEPVLDKPEIKPIPVMLPEPEAELARIHFPFDSDEITPEEREKIQENAEALKNNREVVVRLEGHADAVGPETVNLEIAWERAEAVREALIREDVWPSQLQTFAVGEYAPLVSTDDRSRANRRVELRVVQDPEQDVDGTVDGSLVFELEEDGS